MSLSRFRLLKIQNWLVKKSSQSTRFYYVSLIVQNIKIDPLLRKLAGNPNWNVIENGLVAPIVWSVAVTWSIVRSVVIFDKNCVSIGQFSSIPAIEFWTMSLTGDIIGLPERSSTDVSATFYKFITQGNKISYLKKIESILNKYLQFRIASDWFSTKIIFFIARLEWEENVERF